MARARRDVGGACGLLVAARRGNGLVPHEECAHRAGCQLLVIGGLREGRASARRAARAAAAPLRLPRIPSTMDTAAREFPADARKFHEHAGFAVEHDQRPPATALPRWAFATASAFPRPATSTARRRPARHRPARRRPGGEAGRAAMPPTDAARREDSYARPPAEPGDPKGRTGRLLEGGRGGDRAVRRTARAPLVLSRPVSSRSEPAGSRVTSWRPAGQPGPGPIGPLPPGPRRRR